MATTFTEIDSPRPYLLRLRSSHHTQVPKICIKELNEKKLIVLDWHEPSRLSVIDYCNEWKFLKVILNKWIIFKKQGTYMNLHFSCSLFFKTFQFTCFPVSNNSVMNTVALSRQNLHIGLAADTSNSIYIFSDRNELVILCYFSQP